MIYSLPYVRIVLKQRPPLRYGTILCLDEDRILAVSIFLFNRFVPLFDATMVTVYT